MTYPNKLVRVSDIGVLTEQITQIRGSEEPARLELPRKQQDAERVRLAGAVGQPEVKVVGERLKIYWEGGDGRDYQATLVGLDSEKSYAIVTEVTSSKREESAYQKWHIKNGPWF